MTTSGPATADGFLSAVRPAIDQHLDRLLPPARTPPSRLHEAMRYSVFAGGKRLRPALVIAAYRAFRDDWDRALDTAAAVEMVHTYSLIHDDLPAMDDDDYRRGRLACHRRFDEATAILAGDGLLTMAFTVIAESESLAAAQRATAAGILGVAAGTRRGMIAGQALDLAATRREVDPATLETVHRAKTGALLEASVVLGASIADAGDQAIATIRSLGGAIGLAFQIVDDILDETAPVSSLGKTPGKDRAQGKATYPGVYGMERSREFVRELTSEARLSAERLGSRGALLGELATALADRMR
jgi:geranylgeranyl pyrophosphate synthase